jgi:cytochrome c peroxidase
VDRIRFFVVGLALLLVGGCLKDQVPDQGMGEGFYVPAGFPAPPHPPDNTYTQARWALGKKLFFEKALSRDSSISCASCHIPAFAFSDTVALSKGVAGRIGVRNSPSLANMAYHPYYLREGSVPTLEMQVAVPVQEPHEMDFNMVLLAERLQVDPAYVAMSQEAYG